MKCQICKQDLPVSEFSKYQLDKIHSKPICKKCQYNKNLTYHVKKKAEKEFNDMFFRVIG